MGTIDDRLKNAALLHHARYRGSGPFASMIPPGEFCIYDPSTFKKPTMNNQTSIHEILQERGKTHGKYTEHAKITQQLKAAIFEEISHGKPSRVKSSGLGIAFEDDQLETLDMICHKIGRIVAGNPNVEDHWRDIAGYATLVADRLKKESEAPKEDY